VTADWTTLTFTIIAFSIFLYGVSKTSMPVVGVVAGPLLAAALTPTVASGFALPLLIVGDLIALSRFRSYVNWPLIFRLLPGVLLGLLITAVLFTVMPITVITRMLGVLILISVILEVWRRTRKDKVTEDEGESPKRQLLAGFFGILAGMTSMAANAGGTAMSLYLANMRVTTLTFMGTSAWFFFGVNLLKVPIVVQLDLLTLETLKVNLLFLPALGLGALAGIFIFKRLNERMFYAIALGLSLVAALWLLIHG